MTGLNIAVSPCGEYFSNSVAVDVRGLYNGKETIMSFACPWKSKWN
jgi:hypothetical protein